MGTRKIGFVILPLLLMVIGYTVYRRFLYSESARFYFLPSMQQQEKWNDFGKSHTWKTSQEEWQWENTIADIRWSATPQLLLEQQSMVSFYSFLEEMHFPPSLLELYVGGECHDRPYLAKVRLKRGLTLRFIIRMEKINEGLCQNKQLAFYKDLIESVDVYHLRITPFTTKLNSSKKGSPQVELKFTDEQSYTGNLSNYLESVRGPIAMAQYYLESPTLLTLIRNKALKSPQALYLTSEMSLTRLNEPLKKFLLNEPDFPLYIVVHSPLVSFDWDKYYMHTKALSNGRSCFVSTHNMNSTNRFRVDFMLKVKDESFCQETKQAIEHIVSRQKTSPKEVFSNTVAIPDKDIPPWMALKKMGTDDFWKAVDDFYNNSKDWIVMSFFRMPNKRIMESITNSQIKDIILLLNELDYQTDRAKRDIQRLEQLLRQDQRLHIFTFNFLGPANYHVLHARFSLTQNKCLLSTSDLTTRGALYSDDIIIKSENPAICGTLAQKISQILTKETLSSAVSKGWCEYIFERFSTYGLTRHYCNPPFTIQEKTLHDYRLNILQQLAKISVKEENT